MLFRNVLRFEATNSYTFYIKLSLCFLSWNIWADNQFTHYCLREFYYIHGSYINFVFTRQDSEERLWYRISANLNVFNFVVLCLKPSV